jgi:hypothetical protein
MLYEKGEQPFVNELNRLRVEKIKLIEEEIAQIDQLKQHLEFLKGGKI